MLIEGYEILLAQVLDEWLQSQSNELMPIPNCFFFLLSFHFISFLPQKSVYNYLYYYYCRCVVIEWRELKIANRCAPRRKKKF